MVGFFSFRRIGNNCWEGIWRAAIDHWCTMPNVYSQIYQRLGFRLNYSHRWCWNIRVGRIKFKERRQYTRAENQKLVSSGKSAPENRIWNIGSCCCVGVSSTVLLLCALGAFLLGSLLLLCTFSTPVIYMYIYVYICSEARLCSTTNPTVLLYIYIHILDTCYRECIYRCGTSCGVFVTPYAMIRVISLRSDRDPDVQECVIIIGCQIDKGRSGIHNSNQSLQYSSNQSRPSDLVLCVTNMTHSL